MFTVMFSCVVVVLEDAAMQPTIKPASGVPAEIGSSVSFTAACTVFPT